MIFLTFIYKIKNNTRTFYGKYCTKYISNDHEGLDLEVKEKLINAINIYIEKNEIFPNY
jgi:hypothetical protein